MTGYFENISIDGIVTVVPPVVEKLSEYSEIIGERKLKRHINVTGICERRICLEKQNIIDLAVAAAQSLLCKMNWKASDVNVIIVVTQSSPLRIPSSAFLVQKLIGAPEDCLVFDINMGCTAINVGLQTIASIVNQLGPGSKGVLISSESVHKQDNEAVTGDSLLFGAAATAIGVSYSNSAVKIPYMTKSDGSRFDTIMRRQGGVIEMKGEGVFGFGINEVAPDIIRFKEIFNIKDEDIDYYSLHQAQKMMLDTIAEVVSIPQEKDLRSLECFGNTSGNSILVNLCANKDKLTNNDIDIRILICGFGVGLSWGIDYITVNAKNIFPIEETSFHYEI